MKKTHRLRLAASKNIPIEVLQELSLDSDIEVRRLVASNPSTSGEILERLAETTKPEDIDIICAIVLNPNVSIELVDKLSDWRPTKYYDNYYGRSSSYQYIDSKLTERIYLSIIDSQKNTDSIVEKLIDKHIKQAYYSAVCNHNFSERNLNSHDWKMLRLLVKYPHLSASILERMAAEYCPEIRQTVIDRPNSSKKAIAKCGAGAIEIASFMEGKLRNSRNIINILARDNRFYVRQKVAEYIDTPTEILEDLAKDEDIRVRRAVANNIRTPASTLEILATEFDRSIRQATLRNPNVSPTVKKIINYSKDKKNKNIPNLILERLAKSHIDSRKFVACYPYTPSYILETLARDPSKKVRRLVAKNPNIAISVLESLANDLEMPVRSSVAKNPKTPQYLIKQIAEYSIALYQEYLATNHDLSKSYYARFSAYKQLRVIRIISERQDISIELLEELVKNSDGYNRCYIARQQHTPLHILEQLVQDPYCYVRREVAKNQNVSLELLEKLANDENEDVRSIAIERIAKIKK
jgi:3-methyladenine DNA glycosylase AlkC